MAWMILVIINAVLFNFNCLFKETNFFFNLKVV